MIVPYPPGGGSDLTGRTIGQKLAEALGQTFVIDNRPGATGLIGTVIAAKASPDGYTIILADQPHSINSLVYSKPPYDAIKDFAPLNLLATSPQTFSAHPSFSVSTMKELLALSPAQTAKFAVGTTGLASGPHMTYEWLRLKTGLTLNHVPYKGGGPSLADAIAGQIPLVINAAPASMPHIRAGKLRALAVTLPKRSPVVPELPTIAEAGVPGVVVVNWYGLLAPLNTPRPIVERLSQGVAAAMGQPDVVKRLLADGSDAATSTPEQFRAHIAEERDKWTKVIRNANIRVQ